MRDWWSSGTRYHTTQITHPQGVPVQPSRRGSGGAFRKERLAVAGLGRANPGVDDVDVEGVHEHPTSPVAHPGGVLGPSRDDPPGLPGLGAGPGDLLDRVE